MITFSIVTPSLNQGGFIEDTFKSVLRQKGHFKVQYIVVDGGSNDGTHEIMKKYAPKFKNAGIEYIQIIETDNGQADAINKGFKKANGEILAFLNSDDFYEVNALKNVAEAFEKRSGIEWLIGGWNIVNQKGAIFRSYQP